MDHQTHFPLKKISLFLIFSIFSSLSFSQNIDSEKLLTHIEFLSSDELAGRKPLSQGSFAARKYILDELTSYPTVEALYPDFIQLFSFLSGRDLKKYEDAANLVGFIPGSRSRKVIVVTAHYDHVGTGRPNAAGDSIFNGADDNASGTAALLTLAEYFSKNRPIHSMMFVALDAEEMGLRGAKALVNDFPYPLEQILLNVNMDMLSRSDKNELYASGTSHNPQFRPILEKVAAGSNPKLLLGHDTPGSGREDWTKSSDHGAFFDKKVPHLYFGVEDHEDYHKPSDEFKNIQPEFYVNAVNLTLRCILALDSELYNEKED
ncbi:Peptidase family M28 [Algoriphagus boritolerans DSM 17298 = JCM 18970]|uniref:Peptidase family M28 n=1 Tax=Algoriphagus boritolerans DSM 17298 = JCM 18970 TaxID=1120964 RepID=A0A1H6ADW5_9BACT|nr:Peptidase family M28 [Algoriphagus boritolerans DSM 17298 = JCM 18970]